MEKRRRQRKRSEDSCFVEVHIALSGGDFGTADELLKVDTAEAEILQKLRELGYGEFQRRETGAGEAILYVQADAVAATLRQINQSLGNQGVGEQTYFLVHDELTDTIEGPISPTGVEAWLSQRRPTRPTPRKRGIQPRLGDFFAVPLPDGRFGHIQYLRASPDEGELLQVLDVITDQPAKLEVVLRAGPLFPPVKCFVTAAVRRCAWVYVGHSDIDANYSRVWFRGSDTAFLRFAPGIYTDWFLWSSAKGAVFIGTLTEEHRELEYDVHWSPESLAKRIVTGENPYDAFL
jgi:hypothetical protein